MALEVGLGCVSPAHAGLFSCIVNPISPPAPTSIFNILDFASSFLRLYFSLSVLPNLFRVVQLKKKTGPKLNLWLINLKGIVFEVQQSASIHHKTYSTHLQDVNQFLLCYVVPKH